MQPSKRVCLTANTQLFMLDTVISNVCTYLDRDDLKQLAQTSKKHLELVLPHYKHRCYITGKLGTAYYPILPFINEAFRSNDYTLQCEIVGSMDAEIVHFNLVYSGYYKTRTIQNVYAQEWPGLWDICNGTPSEKRVKFTEFADVLAKGILGSASVLKDFVVKNERYRKKHFNDIFVGLIEHYKPEFKEIINFLCKNFTPDGVLDNVKWYLIAKAVAFDKKEPLSDLFGLSPSMFLRPDTFYTSTSLILATPSDKLNSAMKIFVKRLSGIRSCALDTAREIIETQKIPAILCTDDDYEDNYTPVVKYVHHYSLELPSMKVKRSHNQEDMFKLVKYMLRMMRQNAIQQISDSCYLYDAWEQWQAGIDFLKENDIRYHDEDEE